MEEIERRPCANSACNAGCKVGGIPVTWERCVFCGRFQDDPYMDPDMYYIRVGEWLRVNVGKHADPDFNTRKVG